MKYIENQIALDMVTGGADKCFCFTVPKSGRWASMSPYDATSDKCKHWCCYGGNGNVPRVTAWGIGETPLQASLNFKKCPRQPKQQNSFDWHQLLNFLGCARSI